MRLFMNNKSVDTNCKIDTKEDLIIDMLLTLCGRNLEISFSEIQEFQKRSEKFG